MLERGGKDVVGKRDSPLASALAGAIFSQINRACFCGADPPFSLPFF